METLEIAGLIVIVVVVVALALLVQRVDGAISGDASEDANDTPADENGQTTEKTSRSVWKSGEKKRRR